MDLPNFRVDGKVAIVTAAGKGIGRSIALGLAKAGAKMALVGRTSPPIEEVAREIEGMGGTALTYAIDVANIETLRPMVQDVAKRLGSVDILVNNAGIRVNKRILEHTLEEFESVMRVNCSAPLMLSQAAAEVMRLHGGGSIINISSQLSVVTSPFRVSYCASKAALNHMTRVMAVDLAEYGIRVNALAPGPTHSPFIDEAIATGTQPIRVDQVPLKRIAESDEMVGAALFMASSASSYMTGAVLMVDGGQSVSWPRS